MRCPVHPEVQLRLEVWKTGFCLKCLRHYNVCRSTHNMDSCDRIEGHDGSHRNYEGHEWPT